jgi:hypothetical protein
MESMANTAQKVWGRGASFVPHVGIEAEPKCFKQGCSTQAVVQLATRAPKAPLIGRAGKQAAMHGRGLTRGHS